MYVSRYVDPVFLERLHRLDHRLEPKWNHLDERWEIFRDGKRILTVQTVDEQYAPLDNRVIEKLFLIDTKSYASEAQFIQSLHIEDNRVTKMKQKEQDEYIRSCHRDMAPFLRGRHTVN